jgi:hypothetical protein
LKTKESLLVKEGLDMAKGKAYWSISLDWYKQHNRSFPALVRGCLCPNCRAQLDKGEISEASLATNVQDCCSKLPGFISGEMAILESVFRLFLANGNEPLDLATLSRRLDNWLAGDTYRTSAEVLSRLLQDERYYGIRQVPA